MAKKIGQAYLEREQSRFFRPGGGALGRDDEKSQSSDDVEDLDADMGRPGGKNRAPFWECPDVVDYSVFIQKLPALIVVYWEGSWIHFKIPEKINI